MTIPLEERTRRGRNASKIVPKPLRWLVPNVLAQGVATCLTGNGGVGKALDVDTILATPGGWTTMRDVEVGDLLFDEKGETCLVVAATPVMHARPCYRVRFSDGSEITADAEHQWMTCDHLSRQGQRKIRRWARSRAAMGREVGTKNHHLRRVASLVTTREIADSLIIPYAKNQANHAVAVARALDLPEADLPIPPYTFGAWLGDGTSGNGSITCDDPEILDEIAHDGFEVRKRPGSLALYGILGLQARLRSNRLIGNKHVPDVYLWASAEQRLALLQGLLDTDGYCSPAGVVEFTNTKWALASAVRDLVLSLGWKCSMREEVARLYGKDCGPKYRVFFTPDQPVFRVQRKAQRQRSSCPRETAKWRYIVACDPVDSVPVRCIQVDSPSQLFLAGRTLIPTHNSTLMDRWAADLSVGRPLVPGSKVPPISESVIVSTEESAESVIVPKLMAAGADLTKITILDEIDDIDDDGHPMMRGLSLPGDSKAILEIVEDTGAVLLILDPVAELLDDKHSADRDKEVRRALAKLRKGCRDLGCALVWMQHTNKQGGPMGSVAWVNMARIQMQVGKNPDDPTKSILFLDKTNHGEAPGWEFSMDAISFASLGIEDPDGDNTTPAIVWGGPSRYTPEDIKAQPGSKEERAERLGCGDLWDTLLGEGVNTWKAIMARAREYGYTDHAMRKAATQKGITPTRDGFGGSVYWRKPFTFTPNGSNGHHPEQAIPARDTIAVCSTCGVPVDRAAGCQRCTNSRIVEKTREEMS